jgi:hypothetical protein
MVKKLLETMMATTNMVQKLMSGKTSMNNAIEYTITTTIAKNMCPTYTYDFDMQQHDFLMYVAML